ncbi:MAG: UDP-N-acetylmuramoyl-L-alanyl-D-glutamate--2,6-diaminopimelate ligase, partial [Oscillospiraceae bacterium]|nr:UDP-N-acetylmuramoyl-L-alanyl-D-glutamate--2,6-diaminopimelate ligase [Oscillospiraceae bacterium]
MKLTDLIKDLKPVKINGKSDIGINKIEYDSRKVTQNDVFVAVRGYKTDGHNYIEQAIKNGAAAVIAEEHTENIKVCEIITDNTRKALSLVSAAYYGYPSKKMKLIGITGTNGKTTTTYLVKSILEFAGYKVGLIGTNQNMIGSKVIPTERTTPESLELQKLFADMVAEGAEYCVMEVSSHSLCLDRVYGNPFYIGAFTNLTQDHLDFHKTMEEYAKAKSILFTMCERAVVNADDKYVNAIIENADCKVVKYGINKKSDITAKNIKYNQRGVLFEVETPFGSENIRLDIPGEFSVYNALCAIGVCQGTGVGISDIAKALILAKGVKGRAEVLSTPTDYTVMIDYAHTPDGLENIIGTVKGFCRGRVITVFGCGGDRDATKRPKMGKIAGDLSDFCVVTSDNPRTEDPDAIIKDILSGMTDVKAEYVAICDRTEAIEYAMRIAKENDIIILAGKGHETYQILKDKTIHYDEREIVRDILAKI